MTAGKLFRTSLGVVICVSLLLLGWGIRDAAGFFASASRAIFMAAILAGIISASATIKKPNQKGTRTASGQRQLLALLQLITIALTVFLPFADRRGILVMHADFERWVGVAMVLAGYVISVIALRTLGSNYSVYVTIQEQHRLVQNGIYGVVRNPIYLGNLLSWSGACLVFRSWLAIPTFAFFLAFAVLRGAQEERVLREVFSAEFDAYCRRTWCILPFIY